MVVALNKDIKKAWDVVSEIEYATPYQDENGENPVADANYHYLEFLNRGIYIKLCIALTHVGAMEVLNDLREDFKTWNLKGVDMPYWAEGLTCPATSRLSQYVDGLASLLYEEVGTPGLGLAIEITKLQRILLGTPTLILHSKIEPSNEKEIRVKMYELLIHYYPDTVREIPISKVSKTYKPDIGIKSLKTAVEYKFCDSADELKTAIGGVYEDIMGYNGSADWTTFFAVFYMTDPYMTQAQVEAEFEMAGAPHNWKPLLVTGQGQRAKSRRKRKEEAKESDGTNSPNCELQATDVTPLE